MSQSARFLEKWKSRRRTAPARPAAPAPVVQAPPPQKPDSLTVTVFRGTERQQQKFEKPKTEPQN